MPGYPPFKDTDDRSNTLQEHPYLTGTPAEQRAGFPCRAGVRPCAARRPVRSAAKVIYSNGGYTIAGAIAERIGSDELELNCSCGRVFKPLDRDHRHVGLAPSRRR